MPSHELDPMLAQIADLAGDVDAYGREARENAAAYTGAQALDLTNEVVRTSKAVDALAEDASRQLAASDGRIGPAIVAMLARSLRERARSAFTGAEQTPTNPVADALLDGLVAARREEANEDKFDPDEWARKALASVNAHAEEH